MSLGLPSQLARNTVSRSFVRGMRAAGFTCLAAAFLLALVFQSARPHDQLWRAMVAVTPMVVLLWLAGRYRSVVTSAGYLLVGAACTFWFVATFYGQSPPIVASDAFPLTFIEVALVLVGGPRAGVGMRILWSSLGYAAATLASIAAIVATGHAPFFDLNTFLSFLLICALLIITSVSRSGVRRTQPSLHRAAREEQLAELRSRVEVKAAALLHDTVLSHLAAIASSQPGPLNHSLADDMKRDLERLGSEDWLGDESTGVASEDQAGWETSTLFAAIQEARAAGLDVEVTGNLAAVARLDREAAFALALAAKQCLVNVLRHAGTFEAEVAVYGADTEVFVMVIDAGRGFSAHETAGDRLGLRQSVRKRIEAVGGTVQVWSTPGNGTSIMIRVPAGTAAPTAEPVGGPQ